MQKHVISIFYLLALVFQFRLVSGESTQILIEAIHIRGNSSLAENEILQTLPVRVGGPYDVKQEKAVKEVVLSIYRSQGFMNVTALVETKVEGQSATFSILIEEGPLYHFGDTRLIGLTTLPENVIRKNLTYKKGEPFKKRQLFNTQSALYRSTFFENVDIQTSISSAAAVSTTIVDITIYVKQQPTRWLKAGVGWGSEEQERLSLTLTHKNLFRRAYRAELFGTVSHIWQEYKADFVNSYFFGNPIEERTSLSWRKENREGYEFERVLGEASFAKDLTHNIKATWTPYQVKRTKTTDATPEIAAITPELADSRSMILAFNRDKANDLFFPTRGTRSNVVLQRTGGDLGGNIDFNKTSVESKWYQKLFPPVVLAVSGRVGVIKDFSPSKEVPIFERFFTGGGNSVRGYRERGVGPRDATNAPLGGNWMSGGNIELRFPLFWRFNGAVFLDGGQVASRWQGVQTKEWRYSTGGGLRLKTPVGPVRLDYGQKLNPASDDKDHWRIHFSLGESF